MNGYPTADMSPPSEITDIARFFVDGDRSTSLTFDDDQAKVTELHLFGASVFRMESERHRAERSRTDIRRHPDAGVLSLFVLRGVVQVEQHGRTLTVGPGAGTLLQMSAPWSYTTPGPSALLLIQLSGSHFGIAAQNQIHHVTATALLGTSAERALASLAIGLLDRPPTQTGREAEALERCLAILVGTLILTNAPDSTVLIYIDALLRRRAGQIITEQFADPALDSEKVARELGVGIRRVQRLFATEDSGIATEIRKARLDAIATRLRDPRPLSSLRELAVANGFMGLPQAGRAFRSVYGETMSAYRTLHMS
jgi:AraC family transcriptional activator of tynA and feaB